MFRKMGCLLLLAIIPIALSAKVNAASPNLVVEYATNNDCYKENEKITPIRIMVHSTATPGVMAKDFAEAWNETPVKDVCVHAFLDDKDIYQILPWDTKAWHCGCATKGGPSGNNTCISIEICEPPGIEYDSRKTSITQYEPNTEENKKYFSAIWENCVWLCANMCEEFNIKSDMIVSHKEGHDLGFASNHQDPHHWWKFHNKSMDDFRKAVSEELENRKKDKENNQEQETT